MIRLFGVKTRWFLDCQKNKVGHVVSLQILRQGKQLTIKRELKNYPRLIPRYDGFDSHPSYVMVAGLVFVPVSYHWIRHAMGKKAHVYDKFVITRKSLSFTNINIFL